MRTDLQTLITMVEFFNIGFFYKSKGKDILRANVHKNQT